MKNKNKLKFDIIRFWLDEIEIYWSWRDVSFFQGMDLDNSVSRGFWYWGFIFTCIKTEAWSHYLTKYLFLYDNKPVFAYYIWKTVWVQTTRDKLLIYWSIFYFNDKNKNTLFDYIFIKKLVEDCINIECLRRFDICCDIPKGFNWFFKRQTQFKLNKFWVPYNSWKAWSMFFHKTTGELNWLYFHNVKDSENKSLLLRVYNKKTDIKDNNKISQLPEYLLLDDVLRIELEIRPELAKNTSWDDLFNEDYMTQIFYSYTSQSTKIFDNLDLTKIKLWSHYKKINTSDLPLKEILTDRSISMFYTLARKMSSFWHDPIDYLIKSWVYTDHTIEKIIWSCNQKKLDIFDYILDDWFNI